MWKYCEYLLAYLLIIVSFDDITLDVIVLFIFGLILPETLAVYGNDVAFTEPCVATKQSVLYHVNSLLS